MIKKLILIWILSVSILTACQSSNEDDIVLPTRVQQAATQSSVDVSVSDTPQATNTYAGPTLPPSQTPEPTLTSMIVNDAHPTPTQEIDVGTIYYIYNGNSLIAIAGDGSSQEYLGPFDPPLPISDLTASPDGSLLAFIAPGSGSAKEVWISNRNTTYVQPVTCLGLPYIRNLAWSPDGTTIAFLAGQSEDSPLDVYSASWIGSGECPTGNNQQLVFAAQDKIIGSLAYHPDGDVLFYGDGSEGINGFDLETESIKLSNLTQTSGYGPDFALTFNPQKPAYLSYLQSISSTALGKAEGYLNVINIVRNDLVYSQQIPVESLQWSSDGELLLISERNRIYTYNLETGGTDDVTFDLQRFSPRAIFSPDSTSVAYIDGGQDNAQVQQIYIINTDGRNPRQITFNANGTIDDFVWVSGHWNEG